MFPSYKEVDGADPFREPHLFLNLPCFNQFHCLSLAVVSQYSNSVLLTSRVRHRSLLFLELDLHFIVPPRDILHLPGESLRSAHV